MNGLKQLLIHFAKDDSGQAIIEFFLLLFATVLIVSSLKVTLKTLTKKLWKFFAIKIAAPCPECGAGEEFNI